MIQSVNLINLKTRVEFLSKTLLDFNDIDSPDQENQDKLKSFKLLVHAEIEWYFESTVKDIVNFSKRQWLNKKGITPSLSYMILYSPSKFDGEKDISSLTQKKRIEKIITAFETVIDQNNGIKEKNLMKLLVPLGINFQSLDQTWLSTIDSYGSSRGDIAHKSHSVQKQLDKGTEEKDIDFVLDGIKKLDLKIQKLRNLKRRSF